jgi:hypothetical protein
LGVTVLRVFAKLGGRSRDFVYQPPLIHYTRDHNLENGIVVSLTLQPNTQPVSIALDKAFDTFVRSRLLDADHQVCLFYFIGFFFFCYLFLFYCLFILIFVVLDFCFHFHFFLFVVQFFCFRIFICFAF